MLIYLFSHSMSITIKLDNEIEKFSPKMGINVLTGLTMQRPHDH